MLTKHNYTYGDSALGDLLTGYNGQEFTVDEIGNILYDGTWTYTWQHGRQLASITDGDTTWSYTYNADGLRTKKTNGTDVYTYAYYGGQLRYMEVNGKPYYITYAPDGTAMGIVEDDVPYYFETNQQGDVVGLLTYTGAKVVSYEYDAWGNVLSITGSRANTIGKNNPIRYRGYVYDNETGYYYLQTRYYNPELGRFISADGYASTGQGLLGNNMFAYCGNNPVNRADPSGQSFVALLFLCGGVALALSGCSSSNKYGAAPDYVEIAGSNGDRSKNPNCYSYAIGIYDRSYDPGKISGTKTDHTIDSVADAVEADLRALGRGVRRIKKYNSKIGENEYRIALRVSPDISFVDVYGNEISWDYHFMVQTSDGCWAEKHGPSGASILHGPGKNPDNIPWICPLPEYDLPLYEDPTIYFAITY